MNHPNRSKQQQPTHTPGPVDRLNEWWQFGNKSDPTYAAGNAQFATDVGFLLKSRAELLAALKAIANTSIGIEEKNGALRAWGDCCHIAQAAIAKAEGR